jgi:replicative DNA helicase
VRRLHHIDAERAVLSCALIGGNDVLDSIAIDPDEFYDLRNRVVFVAMQSLRGENKPAGDLQLLEDRLGDQLNAAGGLEYLVNLASNAGAVSSNVEHYQQLIRRSALTRATIKALAELQASDLEGPDLLGLVLEVVGGLSKTMDDPAVTIGQAAKEAFLRFGKARDGGGAWGLRTGFDVLDKVLGGLQPGTISIVAGRPSMGKSALARSIANNANIHNESCGVHVFTPEDSRTTYALRQLADSAKVPLERIRALKVNNGEFLRLRDAASSLVRRAGWMIDDSAGISSEDIALRVRKHKRPNNTRIVVVDYVQLLRERRIPMTDPQRHIAVASQNLLKLARTEDVAVLLLSQLSRACDSRDDKRPMLSDLRQAGELEQDAESVMMVYRDEYYYREKSESPGITEVLIRKNKNGQTGVVDLAWDAPTATHRPLARQIPEDRYA